jgi:hypothetical protein
VRAMTLRPWGDHLHAHGTSRGAPEGDGRFVFPRPVRWLLAVYVGVAAVVCAAFAPATLSDRAYMEAMVLVSAVCWGPGILVAWRAARQVPRRDRTVWRLWIAGFAFGWLTMVRVLRLDDAAWDSIQRHAVGAAVVGVAILVIANTLILRSRSGQRAVLIDVADIVMATATIVAPLVLLVGEPIASADAQWFTLGSAIWFLGALYGTAVAIVLYLRVRPEDRSVARYGVAFGSVVLVATSAQAYLGVRDFDVRPGPFLAAHALCTGFTIIFLAHTTRRASSGLERFPARAQVRRRPAVTLLVLVSIPITGILVWFRREDEWAVLVALGAAGLLVSLFCLRSLLAARETRLLYREVERSADERAELLTDVLAHAEADRHRVATHLHRQSVQLYTALSTVVEPLGSDDGRRTAAARVAEHLRADLGRQSDDLRRFALAVQPPCDEPGSGSLAPMASFTTLLRVQLDGLYPEGRRPRLEAEVDPDLVLDWTDEAVLVRIAEQGFAVLSTRAPDATAARVRLGVDERDLVLDLALDGRSPADGDGRTSDGVEPADPSDPLDAARPELAPIRAGAELLGGTLEVTAGPSTVGIRIRTPLGGPARPGVPSAPRPTLRLVD